MNSGVLVLATILAMAIGLLSGILLTTLIANKRNGTSSGWSPSSDPQSQGQADRAFLQSLVLGLLRLDRSSTETTSPDATQAPDAAALLPAWATEPTSPEPLEQVLLMERATMQEEIRRLQNAHLTTSETEYDNATWEQMISPEEDLP